MKTKKRTRWIIGVVILFVVVFQVLFDPLSDLQHLGERLQARMYLPTARQKWETQGISHYRFDISGHFPLVCLFGGGIEVNDGVVTPGPHSGAGDPDAVLYPGFSSVQDPPLCDYRNYTMPELFELVEGWLAESPASLTEISFDAQYGFISGFAFGAPGGRGLLSPTVSDCCGFFVIENFQALDE